MRYLMLLLFCLQLHAMEVVRVIPVAYDEGAEEWFVLLARCGRHHEWSDFFGRRRPCEQSWIAAARVLRCESGGYYNLNLARNPYCPRFNPFTCNEEYIFFVPVAFEPIEKIRCGSCRPSRDQFAWIPARQIFSSCQELCSRRQPDDISWGFTDMFKEMWPGFKRGYSEYPDHKLIHKYPNYPLVGDAPPSECTNLSWYRLPTAIGFYRKGSPYFQFSTYYPASFELDGKRWPSVEHYMQAMRFPNQLGVQEQIRSLPTPAAAVDAGRGLNPEIEGEPCSNWEAVRVGLMMRANRAKFSQNRDLKCLLLKTGSVPLVFDNGGSPYIDNFWGAGRNGAGKNILGQILMQLRYELRRDEAGPFVEQPLANFTNNRYFPPAQVIAE